jgi:2-polyprenyl-3-methyl-5-hydroxy-6-metoxy-1,4-benzoquinol methylase
VDIVRHYQDAGFLTRVLVAARPQICPLEPLLAWIPPEASVLDVGCGVGLLSISIAATSTPRLIHGIDINSRALRIAQSAARRVASITGVAITFSAVQDFPEWPAELFDVVCMVDVAHHVPKALWPRLYRAAAARVRDRGLLLYKDMAPNPWWCGAGNRVHDLILAQQWIEYCPLPLVQDLLATAGMTAVHHGKWRRYWYAHEFTVFEKRSARMEYTKTEASSL